MKKKDEIHFSEYKDTGDWTLVNDFTIHEGKQLSDRPFMQTKVPKRIYLELDEIRAVDAYDWSGAMSPAAYSVNDKGDLVEEIPEAERKKGYASARYITARATFDDKITVFSLSDGALFQFEEIAHIRISPTRGDKVGGTHNATISDGIGFSGMSSRAVPEKGLMEGEPGSLFLMTDPYPERGRAEEPSLQLELFLGAAAFEAMFATVVAHGEKIDKAVLSTAIELFENEVQASLNEPWMGSEYGLLQREGSDWVSARARIDGVQISYLSSRAVIPVAAGAPREQEVMSAQELPSTQAPRNEDGGVNEEMVELLTGVRARLNGVLALLVALVILLVVAGG